MFARLSADHNLCDRPRRSAARAYAAAGMKKMTDKWPFENPEQAWATLFDVDSEECYDNRRILIVDDDPGALEAVRKLTADEYDVTACAGGRDGLEQLSSGTPFAVVVSNLNLESFQGVEFFKDIRRLRPDAVSMVLASEAELHRVVDAFQEGYFFRFLTGLRSPEAFNRALSQCLEQHYLTHSAITQNEALTRSNKALHSLNSWLEEIAAARTATICRLHKFVTELTGLTTIAAVGELAVNTAAEILKCRRVALLLPDSRREHLEIIAAAGIPTELIERTQIPIGGLLPGRVFAEGTPIIVNLADELPPPENRCDGDLFKDLPQAAIPLLTAEETLGVLALNQRSDGRPFTQECQADMRAVADAAAIAIHNLIRMRERDEARDATIVALAKLAENRDPETGAHLERVQHFCRILAQGLEAMPYFRMPSSRTFIEDVARSSLLHDIGKVGIPDRILLKPGRLTEEEFEVMKLHAAIGGDTIRPLVGDGRQYDFLRIGMEIAYCHHEKYDGTGYPYGLAGSSIPLSARIMAVADVYDALTSRRIYKSPISHDKSIEMIIDGGGAHFDPTIVKVLIERQDEFREVAEKLADDGVAIERNKQANAEKQSLSLSLAPIDD